MNVELFPFNSPSDIHHKRGESEKRQIAVSDTHNLNLH